MVRISSNKSFVPCLRLKRMVHSLRRRQRWLVFLFLINGLLVINLFSPKSSLDPKEFQPVIVDNEVDVFTKSPSRKTKDVPRNKRQAIPEDGNESLANINAKGLDPSNKTIRTGSYHYPSSRSLEKKSNDFKVRVLLFVTTHMSAPHKWHLQSCWPPALQNSQFLDAADVAVYLNPGPAEERKEAMDILRETFKGQDLTIHVRDNQGYQEGAMAALSDATREGWFKDYEWVIRVNPDVIIRDGTFMMDVMQNDPNATGLLINCVHPSRNAIVHTDFFAVKPEVLPPDAFINPKNPSNAERSFTHDIQKGILDKGGARWIPGAHPVAAVCRAGHERKIEDTHVIHFHPTEEMMSEMKCPIPFSNKESNLG